MSIDSLFRQKDQTSTPRGQSQQAVDATPSEQSGGNVRIGTPVWEKFATNTVAQANNRAVVQAENDQIRQAENENQLASRTQTANQEIWKGGDGKLLRKLGKQTELLDAEAFVDHPQAGPEARKSLWDKEIKSLRKDASNAAFLIRDPAFHAASLTDKQREEMLLQGGVLQPTDPEHVELKAKLKNDDNYRSTKADLAQRSWDSEARAREIESMDPEIWFTNRSQPTDRDRRALIIAEAQAKRAETQAADQSAAEEETRIRAELAQGVKGPDVAAKQARLAEIAAARGVIAQESVKAEAPLQAVKAESQAKVDDRGVFGETISAFKRGYAGAAQSANILQGATDATNAQDIANYEAMKKANPVSKDFQEFQDAKGFAASAVAFIKNPVRIISEVLAESAAQMVPSIALGLAGGSVGGAITSAPTGGTAAPATVPIGAAIGAAVGAGSGSFLAEYGSSMMQSMQDAGMDATNPASIQQFFGDEQKLATAREFAVKRGVPIALFDAASMGLAGKFTKPLLVAKRAGEKVGAGKILSATGKELAQQGGLGAGGEALGQLTSTGDITDGKSIFLEGIAEIGTGPVEVAGNLREFGKAHPTASVPPTAPEALKPEVDDALAAIGPEIPAADPKEIEKAMALVNPNEKAAGLAEAVLIERELVQVSMQDDEALAAAVEAVAIAKEAVTAGTGDEKQMKAAEEAVAGVRGRAESVRAVLKIAAGQQPSDLTRAELASTGFTMDNGKLTPMSDEELEAAGLDDVQFYPAEDGSLILTDDAIKRVRDVSPLAADRVKMDEATAIAKAKERALAAAEAAKQLSTTTPDATQGDPARGSTATGTTSGGGGSMPVAGISPIETKGGVEFDVPMKSGAVIRVKSATAGEAEDFAAASVPAFSDSVMKGQAVAVTPAISPQEANVQKPQGSTGSEVNPAVAINQDVRAMREKVPPPPPGLTESERVAWVDKKIAKRDGDTSLPVKAAVASAKNHVAKIAKQSPEIAAALQNGNAEATATRISTDPEAMIVEAMAAGMKPNEALARFKASFDEEIKHFGQLRAAREKWESVQNAGPFQQWYESHYGARWVTEFAKTGKDEVARTIYAKGNPAVETRWDAMPDADKFMEATRMMMQRREGATVTEQSKLWANIPKALAEDLRAMLRALRAMVKDVNLSPALKADIEYFENEIRNVLKQQSSKNKPRTGSSTTDPAQPDQGSKSAGDGKPTETKSTGQTANDGGTQPPRGDSAGPPLAVGSRVEFEWRGRTLTGKIRLAKNGALSIYPDENPSVSVGPVPERDARLIVLTPTSVSDTNPEENPTSQVTADINSDISSDIVSHNFATEKDAKAWMNANGIERGSIRKLDTELFNLQVPAGDYPLPKGWYQLEGEFRFTDTSDKDNGFGLSGPYSRAYVSDFLGIEESEVKNMESGKKPKAPSVAPSPTVKQSLTVQLTPDEQALKDFFGSIGEGLETSPLVSPDFYRSKGIPSDKRAAFLEVADKLYDAGVRAPADLAAKLEKIGNGKLRAYSAALWRAMGSSYTDLSDFDGWAGVYADIDKPAETPSDFTSAKGNVLKSVSNNTRDLLLSDEKVTVDQIKSAEPLSSTLTRKELDEAIEAGITAAARIIVQSTRGPKETYSRLQALYENQPSLNAKTSTSKINQAYSTPSPLAYVASRLADIAGGKVLTEPTGGHGMLMMESTSDQVVQFNEIDAARHERTKLAIPDSSGWNMTSEDATSWTPAQNPDRIAANPPFGSVMAEDGSNIAWLTAAGKTSTIDHAIMLKQLGSMTPDGRAVFIIGGPAKTARSESARKEHYGRGAKGAFFKHLHENFGVVDHFTVDGDLYAKQGAGWNVDVIVIQGRKASRTSLPSAKAPRMLATWDEVFQTTQLTDEQRIQLNRLSEAEVRDSVRGMVDTLAGIGNVGGAQSSGGRPVPGSGQNGTRGTPGDTLSTKPSETEPSDNQEAGRVDGEHDDVTGDQPARVEQGSNSAGEDTGTRGSSDANSDSAGAVRKPVKESGKFQAEYTPFSGEKGLDTLLPRNMVGPVNDAFERIKRDLGGDITKFVHEKLGYPDGTNITKYLAGEQIDAVAAAIWNFERGGALIVGDQTGIGKGRIVAALMKYAVHQGFIPVFITKDAGLHDTMLTEDLPDIAGDEIIPAVMDTTLQFTSAKKRKLNYGEEYFAQAASTGELPGDSNAIFVTYSQITADDAKGITKKDRAAARNASEAPADKWRMRALRLLAPNAVFILDESHLASGQSATGWRVADILRRSTRVYYSSATSVKRPENMGIYFKTNVGKLTGGNMQELTDLMNKGGVPAMQVVSSMLAKDGQYLRRERSFDGVSFTTQISEESADRDRALADNLTGSLREIVTVQDAMRQAAGAINGVIAAAGKRMNVPAPNRAKLETVNFSSKLHNIVGQYLLAIKTQSAADTAIREIRAGKKVVVAVQSTMESAIDGLEFGGFEMSYKGLVLRYLDQMRFLTSGKKTFGRGEVETFEITENGLPEFEGMSSRELEARIVSTSTDPETGDKIIVINDKVAAELMRRSMWDVFARSRDAIESADLGDLPISPIDAMRQAVERAGIRTGEITGRKRGIDEDGEIYTRSAQDTSKPARRVAQSAFNNEDLDFLVINQSGSTGISLHASEKAKVQSTRVMIVAQPNLDINEFMQTLGRIHRSGQVVNPEFILLQTALPAEKRPAAILGKKMSMLNANTTSNAKTDVSEGNTAIDIFNQYGDEMAYKVLERDRDLQDQLRPLGSSLDKFFNEQTGALIPYQDAQQKVKDQPDGDIARTLTGYLAILPVEEQEIFWEKTLADYNAYISYLDQIGANALEAKALDLQAKTTSREVFTEKAEGDSSFSAPSYIETVETKVGKAPLTGEKAVEMSVSSKAKAKQVLQDYLASADAAANDLADKKSKRAIKEWDAEKRAEFLSNQRAQRNVIANAISLLGRFGSVNRNDGNSGLGVIEEIKLDEAHPLTPSKQIAVIRVNDSRETLRVPVTQINEAFTPSPNESAKEWTDSTDIGGESAIATGNLMAAMKALGGAGKVITYTTDSGVDQMGILLPKSFLTKRAAIKARMQIDTAEKLIERLNAGFNVTNAEETISFVKPGETSVFVPASRSSGGVYWRNPRLNAMMKNGEFVQTNNRMLGVIRFDKVADVFNFFREMGETFSSNTDQSGLRTSELPQNLRSDSPEWKAMGKDERLAYLQRQKSGLRTAELPEPGDNSSIDNPRSESYSYRANENAIDIPQVQRASARGATEIARASARLAGGSRPVYFGPERRQDLIAARDEELKRLSAESLAAVMGRGPEFSGGEHDVFISDPPITVTKHTLPGFYGRVLDEADLLDDRTFQNVRKLILRGALPSEYLRRWSVLDDVFSMPTSYDGRIGNSDEPKMAVSQPFIEQDDASQVADGDVAEFFDSYGFSKVDSKFVASPEIKDVTWYRAKDGLLITDAHPRNFRKDPYGVIWPIDLVVTTVPNGASKILSSPESAWSLSEDSLKTAPLPESPIKRGRAAFEKNRALFENAEEQVRAFGRETIGASPKFANAGLSPEAREPFDITRMIDSHQREVRLDRDTFARGREFLEKYPDEVETLLMENAYGDDSRKIDDYQQHAINLLLDRKAQEASGDRSKMNDLYVIAAANIINGREQARAFRMRMDRFYSPAERAQRQIADAIFSPSKKIAARAEVMKPSERKAFLAAEGKKRIDAVGKQLSKLGVRLEQVLGKNRDLQLVNSRIEKEMMKLRNTLEQDIIRFVQKGASLVDIKRRFGKLGAEQAEGIIAKARQDLFDRIKALAASGMSQADIRQAMKDSLKTAPLSGSANGMTDAEIWKMIESDFGIPAAIPARPLPSVTPRKPVSNAGVNPLSTDWSRPEFLDGMNSYTFDTKDRAGIMERVEIIRGLAGAVGKIDSLDGDQRIKAEAKLKEIDQILSKYGTDAKGIFNASKGIESYGFDVTDIAHVAAVARAINSIDADIIDKATEYLYFSMLSGLQTMVVNATAIVPAAWESTVGRGVNMAINHFVNDPMAEQYGEGKYILKALAPAISRAKSNFMASMAAQHPMFDRDVNAMEIDWDKILGGGSHRMIGSIPGRKGDLIRLPMRLLTATDDFNRTLIACCEVGTFAYRMAKMRGFKDGSKEMGKFIREEVNSPGSLSYKMASQKASRAIYSNPLPGQMDPHTKKSVPVNDLGDVAGFLAGKLTSAVSGEHDNIFVKAVSAALRISFFPFQRTPFNIIRKGVRHTLNPFSLFDIALGVTRNAKDADGKWSWKIEGKDQFAMDRMIHRAELIERFGQQLQGAVLMLMLIALSAGEGDEDDQDKRFMMTGSSPFLPTGMAERDARMRSGVGPFRFSWRNKDGTELVGFSYGRLEPVATILAATIDTIKSFKREMRGSGDTYNAGMAAMGGFVSQAQDKSFMKGIGDFIKLSSTVMTEPDLRENRKALQFLAGRAAMVMPNIIKQPIREMDSQFREKAQGFTEELMYQAVPYGQKPAKVDPYGKPLEKPGFAAGRIIDVADIGKDTVNPIDKMLLKWSDKTPNQKWFPQPIMNGEFKHTVTKKPVKMNASQLQEFREQSGKRATALLKLQKLNMENPTIHDVEKVKDIISQSRSDMKKILATKFSRQ